MVDIDKQTISKLHELLVKKIISPAELLQETVKRAQDADLKAREPSESAPKRFPGDLEMVDLKA